MKTSTDSGIPLFHESTIWSENESGIPRHHVFGLTCTSEGTVLAFTEARLLRRDEDPHHLVLKRSEDLGKTWGPEIFIERADGSFWESEGASGRLECWTNACALTDRNTGRIFFFYALNEGAVEELNTQRYTRAFYRSSDDDGRTWSDRREVTDLLKMRKDGTPNQDASGKWNKDANGFPCDFLGRAFHMPGPGHSIQLRSGRLLVHFWNRTALAGPDGIRFPEKDRRYGLSLIYSDDGGETWKSGCCFGHDALPDAGLNESRIVELDDGVIYMNARSTRPKPAEAPRGILYGSNGGLSWRFDREDREMPPFTQVDAGLTRINAGGRSLLLLSHPGSPDRRIGITVSVSEDDGRTWRLHKKFNDGGAGYSDLVALPDGMVGLLYGRAAEERAAGNETNERLPAVAFARFNLAWLES